MGTATIFKFATICTVVRTAYTRVEYAGSDITLVCNQSTVRYPMWRGPNDDGTLITYNYRSYPVFNYGGLGDKSFRVHWDQNERDIIIQNLTIPDGGNYTCQTDLFFSRQELYVRVRPKKPQILDTENQTWREIIRGTEDQDVSLTCISSGGYPAPFLDWYRTNINANNILLSSRNERQGNDSMFTVTVISNFNATREHDRKKHICRSSYDPPSSPQSSFVVLYLRLKPANPVISGDVTVKETNSSTLKCKSEQARPAGKISWTLNGHTSGADSWSLYDNASETYTTTSSYTTRTLYRQDNGGMVTCIVGHEAISTPLTTKATLNILFAPDAVYISGNRIVVADGSNNLTLKCRISSANPVSNITWTGPGMPLTTISNAAINGIYSGKIREEEVTFTPNRDLDGKTVSCTADHYLLQSDMPLTEQVTLDLKYSPQVTITDVSPKEVTEGDNDVRLHCSADSKPASNFTWYQAETKLISSSDAQLSNEFEYFITMANRSHYGEYKCCASNEVGSACSKMVRLQILFPPLDVQIYGNKIIAANGTNELKLTCETGTAYPVATVVWKIGSDKHTHGQTFDREGQYGGIIRTFTITLYPTRHMDGLKIQCEAYNNVGSEAVKEDKLNINYGPITTVLDDSPKIVIEGQSDVSVTCSARSKPPSQFRWYKAGISKPLINGTGTLSSNTLSYTIATVNRTHAGNYRCTAENGITNTDNSDGEIQLIVHYYPDISISHLNGTDIVEGARGVTLLCTANADPITYAFAKWTHFAPDGSTVIRRHDATEDIKGQISLKFRSVEIMDSGIYECSVTNGIVDYRTGKSYASINTTQVVKGRPLVTKSHSGVTAAIHANITLTVSYYSNDGTDPIVLWFRIENDTKQVINKNDTRIFYENEADIVHVTYYNVTFIQPGNISYLHIIDVNEDDFVQYKAEISNSINTTVSRIWLRAQHREHTSASSLNVGAAVGGAIAAVLAVVATTVAVIFLLRRYRHFRVSRNEQRRETMVGFINGQEYVNMNASTGDTACKAGAEGAGENMRPREQPYASLNPERNLSSTYEKLTTTNQSDKQKSAAREYDDLESGTTHQHIYTGLRAEATAKPSTDKVAKQRMYENTRRLRSKDADDKDSKEKLGHKVAEPEALYSNLMIQNA